MPGGEVKLEVGSSPTALNEIQGALEAFWRQHDHIPSRIRTEVGIAVIEIAANILKHARAAGLLMELRAHPDAVEVEFTDGGDAAEVDLSRACMPDELAEGGRGLALAQAAVRILSYFRDELGNHWRLVSKAFSSASQQN